MGAARRARSYGMLFVGIWLEVCTFSLLHFAWAVTPEEQSERLYTQGLIPFRQERYEEALELFHQAAAEEPAYDLAVYYLGVTYGKLGQYTQAARQLERALALLEKSPEPQKRPGFASIHQDLAIVSYHLGDYRKALDLLDTAERVKPQDGFIHYYKGLCYYRLAEHAPATASLKRAAALEPQVRSDARDLIQQLKRWEVRLGVGSRFDSNVILTPDDAVIPGQISDEDDFRFTFSVGGTFELWRSLSTYLMANYDFYHALYTDLSDFDVQAHRFKLTGGWQPFPDLDLSLGLEGGDNYFRLGGDDYLNEIYGMPFVGYFAKPWAYTLLSYRWTNQNYLFSVFDPERDGVSQELRVRQYFLFGQEKSFERSVFVGYQYSMDNPSLKRGNDFQYTGNQAEVGFVTPFLQNTPWETSVELAYAFRNKDYAFANTRSRPFRSRARDDDTHRVFVTLRKPLPSILPSWNLEVYVSYLGTINDSNIDVFEYNRHIVSIGFQAEY